MSSHTPSRSVLRRLVPTSPVPLLRLLRPRLTSRPGSTPLPFQDRGEISPGKNALLHCTTAGFTPLRLDHESFAVLRPLALLGNAFYPVLVHRLAAYASRFLPTLGHPYAVALRFIRYDQLMAGLAPAGVRPCWAHKKNPPCGGFFCIRTVLQDLDGLGLGAFLAFRCYEGNALVLFERLEACTEDVGVVSEEVLATRFRLDETIAFFVVEPFNNTDFSLHFCNPYKN